MSEQKTRVTPDDVAAAIKAETYTLLPNGRTTVCQLTLDNGFTVEGMSACVAIENYDQVKGEQISRTRAVDQVWQLLGFRLADKLTPPGDFMTRLVAERIDLAERTYKLEAFTETGAFADLDTEMQQLLQQQLEAMTDYLNLLVRRISILNGNR